MATTRPVALVTGASSGIGKETARAFVAAGFEVIGTGRKTSGLTPPAGVTYLDLDVGSDDSATAAVREVIDRFGGIDVLVNNAGIGSAGAVEENSVTQAQNLLNINVLGVIRMTKAVLPHMRAQGGGRVINISSVLGIAPQPFMALYVASKHAIEGYSESLDHEVREHGVRVLLVQPAYTKTSFDTNAAQPDTPLPLYAERRRVFDEVIADAMRDGDDPTVVAKVIVTAATDRKPKLRYTAGPLASRVTTARRLVPAGAFDKQIRKNNRLPTDIPVTDQW
ncbi:oxidoreductase [Streptomyces violarus]|uniref:oxidoreductase n=1 Tax=Streptomyces violarus TaxID=67380 RepID=UPI0021C07564|nr:oxidoreductase [Streptomyces violarus]MCT9139794.1 oxidoreductase [Streptomyces violarus]